MSIEQINSLIEVEVLSEGSAPTSPKNEPEIKDDRVAADILSAPEPAVSPTLKTRKQLIAKIREVCAHRGIDPKPMNLGRRRKNSLQDIIQCGSSRNRRWGGDPRGIRRCSKKYGLCCSDAL